MRLKINRFMRLTSLAERLAHSRIITPVIVKVEPGYLKQVASELRIFSFEFVDRIMDRLAMLELPMGPVRMRVMPRFNMLAAVLPREVIFSLAEDRRINRIFPDNIKYALQYPTVSPEGVFETEHRQIRKKIRFTSTIWTKKVIGADLAHNQGFYGKGVTVAVIDTGSSVTHAQTVGRVEKETVMPFQRFDSNGHGTWTTTCVGGSRALDSVLSRAAGKAVECEGVAPKANLLAIKALGYVIGTGTDSDIIQALDIALTRGADVISMSLGGPSETERPEDESYYSVFEEIIKYNVIPVVAAGNEGPKENTIGSPGCLPQVLTIGAYDPVTGEMADFSSRGPTNWGDIKPDVVAPGVNINSACVGILDPAGDGIENRFSPISGTSMATPHASGLIALMREAHSRLLGRVLTVDEVKKIAETYADHPKNNDSGWGCLTFQKYLDYIQTEYGVR
jgi:subtilisin family serine protease